MALPGALRRREVVCTIAARNNWALVRTMFATVRAHSSPHLELFALVVDVHERATLDALRAGLPGVELVALAELKRPEVPRLSLQYTRFELCSSLKPVWFEWLLRQRRADAVLFVDPDMEIYDSLERIFAVLRSHSFFVTPHLLLPLPEDGFAPSTADVQRAGVYNMGIFGIARAAAAYRWLRQWAEYLDRNGYVDIARQNFGDQLFVNFLPGFAGADCVVSTDPSVNVAYWNLPERARLMAADSSGAWRVAGRRLLAFHFTGFEPESGARLSKYDLRATLGDYPWLAPLVEAHRFRLLSNGWRESSLLPYGLAAMRDGEAVPRVLQEFLRHLLGFAKSRRRLSARIKKDDFFDTTISVPQRGSQRMPFVHWSLERAALWFRFNSTCPRLAFYVHSADADLQRQIPEPWSSTQAADALERWFRENAVEKYGIPRAWLDKAALLPRTRPRLSFRKLPLGVNLVGWAHASSPLGDLLRYLYASLTGAGVPVSVLDLHYLLGVESDLADSADRLLSPPVTRQAPQFPYAVNVIVESANGWKTLLENMPERAWMQRFTIGAFEELGNSGAVHDWLDEAWVIGDRVSESELNSFSNGTAIHAVSFARARFGLCGKDRTAAAALRAGRGLSARDWLVLLAESRPRCNSTIAALDSFLQLHSSEMVVKTAPRSVCSHEIAARQKSGKLVMVDAWNHTLLCSLRAAADCFVALDKSAKDDAVEALALGVPVLVSQSLADQFPRLFGSSATIGAEGLGSALARMAARERTRPDSPLAQCTTAVSEGGRMARRLHTIHHMVQELAARPCTDACLWDSDAFYRKLYGGLRAVVAKPPGDLCTTIFHA